MKEKTIYALGFFDGVHLGHQALLRKCRELAKLHQYSAGALTFIGHPDTLVLGQTPKFLTTEKERKALLLQYNMDTVAQLPFTKELMEKPWQDFLQDLMQQGAAGFVCGYDFRFGYKGEGTAQKLEAYCQSHGLPCAIVEAQIIDGLRISSTYIRQLLENGQVETANAFLGHRYAITGTVVTGRGLGHTIGIPTANILLQPEMVQPKTGVYACSVQIDGKTYAAVTNIGSRPTVGGHQLRLESWVLNFDGDLYGKELTVRFHSYLRSEEKFPTLEDLQAQIQKDAEKTLKILEN